MSALLLLLDDADVEEDPAGDEEDAADGCEDAGEGAVGAFGDGEGGEGVQGAAEKDDSHDKAVASPDQPFVVDLFGQEGHEEEGEDVVELVADARLEDGDRLGGSHGLELVGGKGAEGDREGAKEGCDRQKVSVHIG